jgi:hypothetical protein
VGPGSDLWGQGSWRKVPAHGKLFFFLSIQLTQRKALVECILLHLN